MDVVKELLRRGVLITPEAADVLSKRPELAVNLPSKPIITIKDLQMPVPVQELKPEREHHVKVLWSLPSTKTNTPVSSVAETYSKRFAFYRELLEQKADKNLLVSISRLSRGAKASVIGMVRETFEGGAVVEDGTGKARVLTKEPLIEDECVLATGFVNSDSLTADVIIFPDVPMAHAVRTSDEALACVFTNDVFDCKDSVVIMTNAAADKKAVERLGESNEVVWIDGKSDSVKCVRAPCALDIGGIVVIVHRTSLDALAKLTGTAEPERAAQRLLKARHIDPKSYVKSDPLLMKEVPDIVCFITGAPFAVNYKSVTVVSPGTGKPYAVDLKTREVKQP